MSRPIYTITKVAKHVIPGENMPRITVVIYDDKSNTTTTYRNHLFRDIENAKSESDMRSFYSNLIKEGDMVIYTSRSQRNNWIHL